MIQIAVPNKGALSEDAILLLKEAGYRCSRYSRELIVSDRENDIEFVFLRPRDIAVYVGNGIVNLGITGRDLVMDSCADVVELMGLEFGRSRFCYAAPAASGIDVNKLDGLRIATSYPEIVRRDLKAKHADAKIVRLDGAVEISVRLGVADLIADVVESGQTLAEAGLTIIGPELMRSEALLIGRDRKSLELPQVSRLLARLRGILLARNYAMIEYDVPAECLAEVCKITPGIESPTIAPLDKKNWVAVKAMIKRGEINKIMDELYAKGARGIIVMEIRSCRI